MTRSIITHALAFGLAVIAAQGCGQARDADKAAKHLVDQRGRLDDQRAALADKKVDEVGKIKDTVKAANDVAQADAAFAARRLVRIETLRAQHEAIGTQPMLISTMADAFPLTDAGRADVNEKLQVLQMRLDEATNLIDALKHADADDFAGADQSVADAMDRVEDARKAAWHALDKAPRTDRAS